MDTKTLWEKTLAEIELQTSKAIFLTWFKNSRLLERNQDSGVVIVGTGNNFAKEWIKTKYNKAILEILRGFDTSINKIEYVVLNEETKDKIFSQPKEVLSPAFGQMKMEEFSIDQETNLHPKYNFKNFVVGSSNEMAYAASVAVSKEVGKKYNPLFIYGGTGLGKTHLIQAIGNEIIKNYKNRVRVKYITSEKFVNDVVWAIRNKRMDDVKNKYRNIDILIVDDIQFIGGKERSEEEFFHTFNILYQNNKQIIISSDRPPSQIPTLEDRLRSRFEGGMIVDITYPDYEMKMAIVNNKTQEKNITLPDEISHIIASKIQRNIREIEGVINKIIFYREVKNTEIDVKTTENIINSMVQQTSKSINFNTILKCVADFFQIPQSEIINKSRRKEVVVPRQISMFLLRDMLGMSYPDIGLKLGKKDHTTAIHSFEKIQSEMIKDKNLNQKIILIKDLISKSI